MGQILHGSAKTTHAVRCPTAIFLSAPKGPTLTNHGNLPSVQSVRLAVFRGRTRVISTPVYSCQVPEI